MLGTCKLNDIDPMGYLRDTLARLAVGHPTNRLDELVPWRYAARSPPPAVATRIGGRSGAVDDHRSTAVWTVETCGADGVLPDGSLLAERSGRGP